MLYAVTCTKCGDNLKYDVSMDSDKDVSIEVNPCDNCMAEAAEEARVKAESE